MSKNPHLSDTDVFESLAKIIPDTHETRLIGLIEACKIVAEQLERDDIEFAKKFLSWAIAEAEKPWSSPMPDAPAPQCPMTND
ncbi:hypothetical protein [Nostoc sp. LPT]|uniref:hypothetical protein n=1 Tax=Nostoc sp. LPT TaxID=2815387 RepID=UPI001D3B04FA|nr:hypothetical protein [Nostoc sp. LPT]MBN4004755.1 hypothetical protein [Nostoc sp. LPT]